MTAGVEVDVGSAMIEYRSADGELLTQHADRVSLAELFAAAPFRTFRWHEGQPNYSGMYWAATESGGVGYESRLEQSVLLMADFDPSVRNIKSQPFRLVVYVNRRRRRHIPDYLLCTDSGPVVVDVVRGDRLTQPKIEVLRAWTKRVVESLSWRYEVASEQPPVLLANVRFLAGCRRESYINAAVLEHLRSCASDLDGLRIDDALQRYADKFPRPLVHSALTHMLWRQELIVDLTQQIRPSTVLEVAK
ncbi:TnsA-like heteromeric transposase endonuclease subunit [Mycolicibacterium mucogenicum]|uniref:TnsA-like heteromeric transposase endonuclease subunit n=1 Tax=Mycolicibacterium mucogenicum TaxID=56689 RepID=UPI000A9CAAFF|nr:TnsA-like heteromeric transposase endonuclease subunit [Mycolicibacterium mucogenicum]